MSSKFIQGSGYPILQLYNSSDVLIGTINMPYVRDDGSKSFIKQTFAPYPDTDTRVHKLMSGNLSEDKKLGDVFKCQIRYSSILASRLIDILSNIGTSQRTAGNYMRLIPRSDKSSASYKVVYRGDLVLESQNIFTHNVDLNFDGTELITSLSLTIP